MNGIDLTARKVYIITVPQYLTPLFHKAALDAYLAPLSLSASGGDWLTQTLCLLPNQLTPGTWHESMSQHHPSLIGSPPTNPPPRYQPKCFLRVATRGWGQNPRVRGVAVISTCRPPQKALFSPHLPLFQACLSFVCSCINSRVIRFLDYCFCLHSLPVPSPNTPSLYLYYN